MAANRPILLDKLSLKFYKALQNTDNFNLASFMVLMEVVRQQLASSSSLSEADIGNLIWVALRSSNKNSLILLKTILSSDKTDPNMIIPSDPGSDISFPLLVIAAKFGNFDALKFLLEDKKANYHSPRFECTPLQMACATGRLDIVNYLLDKKIAVEPEAMVGAILTSKLDVIQCLINKGGYSVNASDKKGMKPITYAISVADVEAVRLLVDNGAELSPTYPIEHPMVTLENQKRRVIADPSFGAAIKFSHLNLINEILLNNGILNNVDSLAPALFKDMCALQSDQSDDNDSGINHIAKLLTESFDIIFKSGSLFDGCKFLTPEARKKILYLAINYCPPHLIPKESTHQHHFSLLHLCAQFNLLNHAKCLIDKGHAINVICDEENLTALHIATVYNAKEMVTYLLELGINLNAKTKHGETALHFAINKPNTDPDIIDTMLSHPDFSFNNLDDFQRNIIHKAVLARQPGTLKKILRQLTLENYRSALFAKDYEGKTPLVHAVSLLNTPCTREILLALMLLGVVNVKSPLNEIEPISEVESSLLLSVMYMYDNIDSIAHLCVRLLSTQKLNRNILSPEFLKEILAVMLSSNDFQSYIPANLKAYANTLMIFFLHTTKAFSENKTTGKTWAALRTYKFSPIDVVMLDGTSLDNEAFMLLFSIFNNILTQFRVDARSAIKYKNAIELEEQQHSAYYLSIIIGDFLEKLIVKGEGIQHREWYMAWQQNLKEVYSIFSDINHALSTELEKVRIGDALLAEEGTNKSRSKKRSKNKKSVISGKEAVVDADSVIEVSDLKEQFKMACYNEDINEANRLLALVPSEPYQPDILIHCIDSQLNKSVKFLLDAGYNPNIGILSGVTPLISAIVACNLEAMTMLLEAGVDVCPPYPSIQPLIQVKYKRHAIEEEIKDRHSNPSIINRFEKDLDFYRVVEKQLIAYGAMSDLNNFLPAYFKHLCDIAVNIADVLGFIEKYKSNLKVVLEHSLHESLNILAKKGLSVERVLNKFINFAPDDCIFKKQQIQFVPLHFSLMHIAVVHHSLSALQRLIARGHEVDFKASIDCLTPFHLAITHGTPGIRRYLINQGADINVTDIEENTPLHTAVINNNIPVVCELLSCKARVDIPNGDQDTAIHLACLYFPDILKLLILPITLQDELTPLFSKNKEGVTPIQLLACSKNISAFSQVVTLLRGKKYFADDKPVHVTEVEQDIYLTLLSMGVEIKDVPEVAFGVPTKISKSMTVEFTQRVIALAQQQIIKLGLPETGAANVRELFNYLKYMAEAVSSKNSIKDIAHHLLAVNLDVSKFVSLSCKISATHKLIFQRIIKLLINLLNDHHYKVDLLFKELQSSNVSTNDQLSLCNHLKADLIKMKRFLVASDLSNQNELLFEKVLVETLNTYDSMLNKHYDLITNKITSLKAGDDLIAELSAPKSSRKAKAQASSPKSNPKKKVSHAPKAPAALSSSTAAKEEKQRLKEERIKAEQLRQAEAKAKKEAAKEATKEAKRKRVVVLSLEGEKAFTFVQEKTGISAYLVGGAVLDLLSASNTPSNDFDMIFASTANIREKLLTAQFHFPPPLVAVKSVDTPLSLYQYRDRERNFYLDLVQVHSDEAGWLERNAKTRDFTICALYAQRIIDEAGRPSAIVVDPTGRGFTDFDKKILHLDDAINRFNEDPVRLLRAMKYIAKGFKEDKQLVTALLEWQPTSDLLLKHKSHLWSVLNTQLRLNSEVSELTTHETNFLTYLREYNLVSKLFGVQATINKTHLEVKKALATRFKMIKAAQRVGSWGYSPTLYSLPDAGVASSSSTSPTVNQHPLSYVMGSPKS